MSNTTANPERSTAVRHCREDALSDREFEQLVAATYRLDDPWSLQCRLVVLVCGRLGLRAGELAHLEESWIDWRRDMIVIPRHQECRKGRAGNICGYCRSKAEQMTEYNPGLSIEAAEELMWSPKTEAAAREIPFDADERTAICLEAYFERFDQYTNSRLSVNRRVERAARAADGLAADAIYPHALRATAATYWAARQLDVFALKSLMGWAQLSTAHKYVSSSGERTAQAIRDVRA